MRKKILLLPLLVLSLASVSGSKIIKQIEVLYADETIDNVKIGDVFVVEPKILEYEDQRKTVDGQIILPDGTSKEGKQFTISMPGIYTVNYRAFFGTHEVSISQFYHCHRTSGDFFTSSESKNKPGFGEYSHPLKSDEIKGAKLTLDSKTVFTYDGEIDFSSYSANESFIELIVDTSKQATSDLEKFTIRLTDIEDNGNYVDITLTDSGPVDDNGRGCYVLAGANTQFKTGYEGSTLWNSKYGTNVGMSFRDLPEKGARVAKFYLNYNEKSFYVSPILNEGGAKSIITDLDDKSIYGSNIWEGFKSGKATLSIFANSLSNSSATLIVSKIANIDLSPLDFVDTSKPTITIDFGNQSRLTPPKASLNKPYKVFNAIISDNFDRNLSYSSYVTYSDTEHSKTKDISVINGYFTPKQEGTYRITYVTQDHSNNKTTKSLDITAINDPQTVTLSLDDTLISREIYSSVTLPSIEDVHVTGGSGNSSITRTLFDINNNEINVDGNTFIPDKVGTYKAIYRGIDYIGNEDSVALTINVTYPGHPVFIGDVYLPEILIKGHKYVLPSYSGAEVIENNTVPLESKIYVNDVLLTNNNFTASSACNVKYILEGQTGTYNYSKSIDVVDSGEPLNIANYFFGNFDETTYEDDVTLTASSGNAKDLFASVLPYDNPYIKFSVNPDNVHFEKLIFRFYDSVRKNNSLSFNVRFSSENAYISVGESDVEYEFASETLGENKTFAIDFLSEQRILKDIKHNELTLVKTNDAGETFTGFSGGVYLEISMINIASSSSVKILTISNQVLGNLGTDEYEDFVQPIVILKDKFVNEQEYGANAFIPQASVFDVLSDASVKITVKAPDGTIKINNADASEKHTFKLDQFGTYYVTYSANDSAFNVSSFRRKIVVYDFNPPELTIVGGLKETYKLNDSIKIPSYIVSDNQGLYKLDIFLIMPDDEQRLLLIDNNGVVTSYLDATSMIYNSSFKVDSTTFKAEQYGKYTMRFVAYDNDFNKTVVELHFEVK